MVLNARLGSAPQAPFLDDYTSLLVDLVGLETHQVSPVLEDLESGGDRLGILGRHLEHINGLIEARVGVDRGSERHPDRFQVVDELLLLEVLGSVERHVLHEVSKTELRVVL